MKAALFFQQYDNYTNVYYEVFNEPNAYWLDSAQNYFLYYYYTATTLRQYHPRAKIGGSAAYQVK